jgi:hypothetical protein
MRTCIVCTAVLLLCAFAHAQEMDSTQVMNPSPPPVLDETVNPQPPGDAQTVVDIKWFQQHNQALLEILNVLVDNTYEGQKAKELKMRFARESESFAGTADVRMSAIRKLIDLKFTKK